MRHFCKVNDNRTVGMICTETNGKNVLIGGKLGRGKPFIKFDRLTGLVGNLVNDRSRGGLGCKADALGRKHKLKLIGELLQGGDAL